jgi:hypothetical protein
MKIMSGLTLSLVLMGAACGRSPGAQQSAAASAPDVASATPAARTVALPAGMVIRVRLNRALSTVRNRAGDPVEVTLDSPVVVDGRTVLSAGTTFAGHVTRSAASGRLKGRGVLGLTLDALEISGRQYPISTSTVTRTTEAHERRNIELIGGSTGVGALIGAVADGGKGAGIGAAIGTAGGTGLAAGTGKKEVELPAGTILRFTVKSPVTIVD